MTVMGWRIEQRGFRIKQRKIMRHQQVTSENSTGYGTRFPWGCDLVETPGVPQVEREHTIVINRSNSNDDRKELGDVQLSVKLDVKI